MNEVITSISISRPKRGEDLAQIVANEGCILGPKRVEHGHDEYEFLVGEMADPMRPAEVSERTWRTWDRGAMLGVEAAFELFRQSKSSLDEVAGPRTAVIIGCGITGMPTLDPAFSELYHNKNARLQPLTIPKSMPSAIASAIADALRITGPSFTVSAACASGIHALQLAQYLIQTGTVDRAIVGGVEASLERGPMIAWRALRVLSQKRMRPFQESGLGINLSEGAALMLVERKGKELIRTQPSLSIVAARTSTNGGHLTRPDTKAMRAIMQDTLFSANTTAESVVQLNSHGTGTAANDACEIEAILDVFGNMAGFPQICATKSFHGHFLAASASIELAVMGKLLLNGQSPPILNEKDGCSPFPAASIPPLGKRNLYMKTAYGFGGMNGCIVLGVQ